MKIRIFPLIAVAALAMPGLARAGLIYSGIQDVAVPLNFEGVYLNVATGATSSSLPGTWSTAPWVNPFFGAVAIANSPLLLPVVAVGSQIANLAYGTTIDSSSSFVLGESGSDTHVGPAAEQFQPGDDGYMGFKFQMPGGGPYFYGWMRIEVNPSGDGTIIDWAYDNTAGTAVNAGWIESVPEPGGLLAGLASLATAVIFRRRTARS